MIQNLSKHIMMACLTLTVLGMLTCCSDDNVIIDDAIANGESQYPEGTTIGFEISLDATGGNSTRADVESVETDDDAIDNYVDIDGIRILFFDKDDNFLFDPTNYGIEKIEVSDYPYDEDNSNSYSRGTKRWWIRIPVAALEKNGVLETLKNNDFKIAVLANWPNDNELTFEKGEKIYKISQYWPDNVYKPADYSYGHLPKWPTNANGGILTLNDETAGDEETDEGDEKDNTPSYGFMGAYKNWVTNAYATQEDALAAVRNNTSSTPHQIARVYNGGQDYTHIYKHIWRVWNFGSTDLIPGNTAYWSNRIKPEILAKVTDPNGFDNYGSFYLAQSSNDTGDGLSFKGTSSTGSNNNALVPDPNDGEKTIAIKTRTSLSLTDHENAANLYRNYFSFNAYATGTLKVWAKSGSSSTANYIGIQKGDDENQKDDFIKSIRTRSEALTSTVQEYTFDIGVTGTNNDHVPGDPVNVKIYPIGATVDIYQIEYIEDKYLYESDREALLPTEDNAIPMYGVQTFGAIEDRLIPGQTFNLSNSFDGIKDGYDHKKLYLLRSLAKVELLLPAGVEPTHVYMRFINRFNRCEPIDVSTPTNESWYTIDNEIARLKDNGTFFNQESVSYADNDAMHSDYRDNLAWFYGAWTQWKDTPWEWNGMSNFTATEENNYPRIFNSRISRSNYAHMIKSGTRDGKTRYLLYVPDKNVADPNTRGNMNSTPKIAHIELRTASQNDDNLDDNGCYRIYFADVQPPQHSSDHRYDTEEERQIKTFYPIVRNHIYRFNVKSINGTYAKSRKGGATIVDDCTVTVEDF